MTLTTLYQFLIGKITLVQESEKPWGDTSVYVEIANAGFDREVSTEHKFHIHELPVGEDVSDETDPCSSAGGHWNPFAVDIKGEII